MLGQTYRFQLFQEVIKKTEVSRESAREEGKKLTKKEPSCSSIINEISFKP